MRKLLFLLFVLASTMANARKDVTKFLGIPVDGLKSEMIQKLKAKGYVYNQKDDYLTGEFNGHDVQIRIVTNNNKVWRIMLTDEVNRDEASIRIRFNNLVRQFNKNKKYIPVGDDDYSISDDDDISYEISVKSKRYEAVYYQVSNETDSLAFVNDVWEHIRAKYTDEQLTDTTELMKDIIRLDAMAYIMELNLKKTVWFMISDFHGKYYISMFYDNEWNHSDGEEL